jgi:cytoskeletal protein CcmA (bactofilin family)
MRYVKNNQGYALLTVLLTIVLFIMLFLSFMGQAFSTVKQNREVEKSSQSVALAEMGISYYHAEVKNIYEAKQKDVYDRVKQQIDQDRQNNSLQSTEMYKNMAARYMEDALKLSLQDRDVSIEGKPSDSVKITVDPGTIKFVPEKNEIQLVYRSTGKEEGKTASLSGNLAINIANPDLGGSGPELVLAPPKFNIVKLPTTVKAGCTNPLSINNSGCTEIVVNETKTYNENTNKLANTLVYSDKDLTIAGNANSAENVQLHSNNLTLGANMNNITNSVIETKNDATFGSQLRLDSSKLYIGGNLNVAGHLDVQNVKSNVSIKSSAFVRGTAKIDKQLNIYPDTIMCVKGDVRAETLNLTGELFVEGKIYIKGVLQNAFPGAVYVNQNTNPEILKQKCGATFDPPELFIGWGEHVTNNVVYN